MTVLISYTWLNLTCIHTTHNTTIRIYLLYIYMYLYIYVYHVTYTNSTQMNVIPSFRYSDNSPFWVGIFITFNILRSRRSLAVVAGVKNPE